MNITKERLTELLRSGKCILVSPEESGFKLPTQMQGDEGCSSIRLESVGTTSLSNDKLVLIIKDDYIVGTATLNDDQYEYLGQGWLKTYDDFLFQKWQDETYGG